MASSMVPGLNPPSLLTMSLSYFPLTSYMKLIMTPEPGISSYDLRTRLCCSSYSDNDLHR